MSQWDKPADFDMVSPVVDVVKTTTTTSAQTQGQEQGQGQVLSQGAGDVMVFEHVFQAAPLGLNLLPHRLIFTHPSTGQQHAITCCAVISLATATTTTTTITVASSSSATVQRGDILILVQSLHHSTHPHSLIQDSLSSHITDAKAEIHFEKFKDILVTTVFPKKVTLVRLLQSPLFQSGWFIISLTLTLNSLFLW